MAVPWTVLVSALPTLIDSAGKLFKKAGAPTRLPDVSGPVSEQLDALASRLAYFEEVEAEQARLMKATVESLQALAVKAAATEKRASIALGLSAVSTLVAIVALAMVMR